MGIGIGDIKFTSLKYRLILLRNKIEPIPDYFIRTVNYVNAYNIPASRSLTQFIIM